MATIRTFHPSCPRRRASSPNVTIVGIQTAWIPAFAGMTANGLLRKRRQHLALKMREVLEGRKEINRAERSSLCAT